MEGVNFMALVVLVIGVLCGIWSYHHKRKIQREYLKTYEEVMKVLQSRQSEFGKWVDEISKDTDRKEKRKIG